MVQCLGLCPSNAGGVGSIPGQGPKIPHVLWCSRKKKKKKQLQQKPKPHPSFAPELLHFFPSSLSTLCPPLCVTFLLPLIQDSLPSHWSSLFASAAASADLYNRLLSSAWQPLLFLPTRLHSAGSRPARTPPLPHCPNLMKSITQQAFRKFNKLGLFFFFFLFVCGLFVRF